AVSIQSKRRKTNGKKMDIKLTANEVRVLGSLIEKDITTPEYYPLSLNALLNACNQKSNRDPVMQLDEDAVRAALEGLQQQRMAGPARGADSRVTKYEQRLQEVFNFTRPEIAVLCVLLLRGPQTPGELRGRSERLFHFEALDDVQSALQKLMQRDPPLAKVLPRQPGTKESRYAHLLAGDVVEVELPAHAGATAERNSEDADRIARLEEEVAELRREVDEVKDHLERFRRQFE
ncbi:MAG: YceH family protein, partial [Terriglobales bacterium]